MSINKNARTFSAYVVLVCMLMTLMSPILAYAEVNDATFVSDGAVYTASIAPYQNDMGLMASALDLAEVFGYSADFDSESKSIEIEAEEYGKVVLMHNATEFYSNGAVYPCAEYFYSENNVPMVEVGFFTTMFGASYSYDADTNTITIDKNKLSENTAKVTTGDVTVPLYIEPFMGEYGLTTSVNDLAKVIGAEITIDPETYDAVLTDDTKGEIYLTNKGETFTSDFGTFDCLPMYYAEEGVPMIALDFFCALYGISYRYDEATKTLSINTELTQDELDKTMSEQVSLMSDYNFTGWLNFEDVPADVIIEAAKREKADIIALSALMTTTMMEMKKVINMAKEQGVTSKVIIGGAVITQGFADEIGADGYSKDAQEAVELVSRLLGL